MSARVLKDDVLFFQRLLRLDGLYTGKLDAKWGPLTEAAAAEFDRRSDQLASNMQVYDVRSEANIRSLTLRAQTEARSLLTRLLGSGINARIISGTRTYLAQEALYRQGRFGDTRPVVTKARGGHSNHNFGVAWDIGIFTATGGYVTKDAAYREGSSVALSQSIEWGGHWMTFPDLPHYQLKLSGTVAQLRSRFEVGAADTLAA